MGFAKKIIVCGMAAIFSIGGLVLMYLAGAAGSLLVAVAVAEMILLLVATLWTARSLTTALNQFQQPILQMERKKDISIRFSTDQSGELQALAQSINQLFEHFSDTLIAVNRNNEMLFESGAQIASASAEVESASNHQIEHANEATASVANLSSSISQISTSSNEVRGMISTVHKLCKEGESSVTEVVTAVKSVDDSFQATGQLIQSLAQRSDEIVGIIDVISGIAEQTNLLALNAAIEAARAGEQGRGFAVVADEVRNLAQRTHEATDKVTAMVNAISSETGSVVEQMASGGEQLQHCIEQATRTSTVLSNIITSSAEVEQRSSDIAAATEEQNSNSSHVEQIIETIAELSNQSHNSIHRSNQAISGLLTKAVELDSAARVYSTVERSELNELLEAITRVRMNAVLTSNATEASDTVAPISEIKRLDEEIERVWQRYILSREYSSGDARQADRFWQAWGEFKVARGITLSRAASGNFSGSRDNAANNAGPKFKQARQELDLLLDSS